MGGYAVGSKEPFSPIVWRGFGLFFLLGFSLGIFVMIVLRGIGN